MDAETPLRWHIEKHGGARVVFLEGRITEDATFDELLDRIEPQSSIVVDLEGVHVVSTPGVRQWVAFVARLQELGVAFALERCSPAVTSRLMQTASFRGNGAVRSIFAPFVCRDCDEEHPVLLDVSGGDLRLGLVAKAFCPTCGAKMDRPEHSVMLNIQQLYQQGASPPVGAAPAAPDPDKAPESAMMRVTVSSAVKTFIDAAVDPAVAVGPDLVVLYCNRAYADLMGFRRSEIGSPDLRGLCHRELQLESCGANGQCLAMKAFQLRRHIRMDDVRAQGGSRLFVITALPLLDEPLPTIVEFYRDVTAESRLQARYTDMLSRERKRSAKLEEEVRARTADLSRSVAALQNTQQQLVQSEKMSALGQLIAGIAHELNNPINFIYANAECLSDYAGRLEELLGFFKDRPLPRETRTQIDAKWDELDIDYLREDLGQLVAGIRTGAQRAASVVADLRTVSHAGSAPMRLCDLAEELSATLNLVSVHAKDRVEIVREFGPMPKVRCNGAHIAQVVMNLVVNSIQAIEGKGRIVVTCTAAPNQETVSIEVRDNGRGMPPEVLERVFDPFFTTKEVGHGTGLGLSISYGIVQAHGGTIGVESTVGVGTRFVVTLPTAGPPQEKPDA